MTPPCSAEPGPKEYGIVANVVEVDRVLRMGAKVFVDHFEFEKLRVYGCSRSGRKVEKWSPLWRFENFRAAWIPEHIRWYRRGTKEEMEALAERLSEAASEARGRHPDRMIQGKAKA